MICIIKIIIANTFLENDGYEENKLYIKNNWGCNGVQASNRVIAVCMLCEYAWKQGETSAQ